MTNRNCKYCGQKRAHVEAHEAKCSKNPNLKKVGSHYRYKNTDTIKQRIKERWQFKLFITGTLLLVYATGAVNVDASFGCVLNEAATNRPCDVISLLSILNPIDSYHMGFWLMNFAVLLIIASVIWI